MAFDITKIIEELEKELRQKKSQHDKNKEDDMNKYKIVNFAALYARKIKDEQLQGLIDKRVNPIVEALKKCTLDIIRSKK